MGLLVRLFEQRSIENPSVPLSLDDYGSIIGHKSSSGVNVSRETALTYSAIWRGVNLISRDMGKLNVSIEKRAEGGWIHDTQHAGYNLLRHKPNDAMTAMVFRQTLQGHALMEGNGYAHIWRNKGGEPEELMVLNPFQVTPFRVGGRLWYLYRFTDGGEAKIKAEDIIHIKGFSFDGLMGYNLIYKAREDIGGAMARKTYGSIFFRNNARPSIVIQTPKRLSPEAAANLRASWERIHSGLENAHRTAILEEGMEAKEIGINASDAQLIEQEEFDLVDVANWLNLPVHKVGGKGRTAYASLEQENQAYLDEGLDPWLVTHEEEYRDKLLTEEEKRKDSHRVRFNRKQLVRANLGARGAFYVQMMQNGVMSPDEVREEEGHNPQPNDAGKIYYRPLNLGIVGKDGKVQVPAQPGGEGVPPTPATAEEKTPIVPAERAEVKVIEPRAIEREVIPPSVYAAVQGMLGDVVRRMAKRIGTQAERAASDSRKFCAWLDDMDGENRHTVTEACEPVEQALRGIGGENGVCDWLMGRLRSEFMNLADSCTPSFLPKEAEALAGRLVESLPKEASGKFAVRCGGEGGTPGPCAEDDEDDGGDEESIEEGAYNELISTHADETEKAFGEIADDVFARVKLANESEESGEEVDTDEILSEINDGIDKTVESLENDAGDIVYSSVDQIVEEKELDESEEKDFRDKADDSFRDYLAEIEGIGDEAKSYAESIIGGNDGDKYLESINNAKETMTVAADKLLEGLQAAIAGLKGKRSLGKGWKLRGVRRYKKASRLRRVIFPVRR